MIDSYRPGSSTVIDTDTIQSLGISHFPIPLLQVLESCRQGCYLHHVRAFLILGSQSRPQFPVVSERWLRTARTSTPGKSISKLRMGFVGSARSPLQHHRTLARR